MRALAMTGIVTAAMISLIKPTSLMRATPPSRRMSDGTRSRAMTATAPASSAIFACSGVTTSMITPPLSISARPPLTRTPPVWGSCPLAAVLSVVMLSLLGRLVAPGTQAILSVSLRLFRSRRRSRGAFCCSLCASFRNRLRALCCSFCCACWRCFRGRSGGVELLGVQFQRLDGALQVATHDRFGSTAKELAGHPTAELVLHVERHARCISLGGKGPFADLLEPFMRMPSDGLVLGPRRDVDDGVERRRTGLHADVELRALPVRHLAGGLPLHQILHVLGGVAVIVDVCKHRGHWRVDGHVDGDTAHVPRLLARRHRAMIS